MKQDSLCYPQQVTQRKLYWNPSNAMLWGLLLLPVAIFYSIVYWKYIPLPIEDDYSSMLGFALKWNALHDWPHRLLLVFTNQHNEYKMPLTFGLQAIELSLTHHVHIGAWMWLGNLMALALLVPLWCACLPERPWRERLIAFLPVVWLVMNLGYAEALNFTLTGFQALSALTWSTTSIFLLTKPSWKSNVFAIPAALLACGTNANALLLAPVGFFILLRRRSWVTLPWCAAYVLEVVMYFYRYRRGSHPLPTFANGITYLLGTVGSSFGFHAYRVPAVFAGIVLLLLFALVVKRGSATVEPFGFWMAVWLLLTFAMITYGRAGVDLNSFLVSRYKVNCDLFMVVLYLQCLRLWLSGKMQVPDIRRALPLATMFLVLFVSYSDALGWYRLYRRERDTRYGMTTYLRSHGALSPLTYPPPLEPWMYRPGLMEDTRVILNKVRAENLYEVPAAF